MELPEDRLLITFCTSGLRSTGAANLLVENGFEAVDMSRGLIDWRSAGGPLTPREGRPDQAEARSSGVQKCRFRTMARFP